MRKDFFVAGLGFRFLVIALFLYGNINQKYNDMGDIIYSALSNMINGSNPYAAIYEIEWGTGVFFQPFNYGPITLLFMLPAMLLPYWYNTLWVGMFFINNVYNYLLCNYLMNNIAFDERLQKELKISLSNGGHEIKNLKKNSPYSLQDLDPRINKIIYYAGVIFWVFPWGPFIVTSFLFLPIYLSTLAFGNRDKPFKCGLFIFMAAMSYQLLFLFIPVYAVYHFKKNFKSFKKFLLGSIPSIIIFLIFMVWGPGGIFESLFLHTSEMGYVKCPNCDHPYDNSSVFSIPKILYLISDGKIQVGNLSRLVLILLLSYYLLLYLIKKEYRTNPELYIQKYLIFAVFGFLFTNNYGQFHYFIIGIVPIVFYFQIKKPKTLQNYTIGLGIFNWQDFEKYLIKYHKLPN